MKDTLPTFTLWIEAELWGEAWNPLDDNTDVIVTLEDGNRWVATFFTYANILSLAEKNKSTGECLHGKYWWATDMILVDEVSRARIEEVVTHLLTEGKLERIFSQCE